MKIGVTRNLKQRISSIENSTGFRVHHERINIITHTNNSTILLLEKNLLDISKKWKAIWDPEINFSGMHEFRLLKSCSSMLDDYLYNQKTYGYEYNFYTGVDLCGQYSHKLPKVYYPINETIKGISPILQKDIQKFCDQKNIKFYDFVNLAIFKALEKEGEQRADIEIRNYDDYYKI